MSRPHSSLLRERGLENEDLFIFMRLLLGLCVQLGSFACWHHFPRSDNNMLQTKHTRISSTYKRSKPTAQPACLQVLMHTLRTLQKVWSIPKRLNQLIHNNWVCPKKSGPFHWLGVALNLFKVLGILGTLWGHPRGNISISRGMGGLEKKRGFSDFGLHPHYYREFPRAKSG